MKIKYLGTAAAEAVPAIFCTCATCKQARATGSRDLRSRNQTLINGELMLDYPGDTYYHAIREGLDLSGIHHYLITHTHQDHFLPEEFGYVEAPFTHNSPDHPKFHLYGSSELRVKYDSCMRYVPKELELHILEPYEEIRIMDYIVTPIRARHSTDTPVNYIIRNQDSAVMYLHDTGIPFEETFDYIAKGLVEKGIRFGLVSFDCTEGNQETISYDGHMCLGQIKGLCQRLREMGAIDDDTRLVLSHFSHGGVDINYEECHWIYEAQGFIMAYDGLEITI